MLILQDKAINIAKAKELVAKAAADGAQIVVLPEVFNGSVSWSACDGHSEAKLP